MSLLNEEVKGQLSEVFEGLKNDVNLMVFTDKEDCDTCEETRNFMDELSSITEKINVEKYDVKESEDIREKYDIKRVPAITILDKDKKDFGIKFYGIPAGHEINSLITGIMEVSGAGEDVPNDFLEKIKAIDKPIDIKVFVTLSCPHCPGAVAKAHKLALLNDNIEGAMIESQTFSQLAQKYEVQGVPKIVINEEHDLVGNQPLDKFLEIIEKI
ncbi:MAG: protein disulfide oxidoreductase [Bacillota bacterium]